MNLISIKEFVELTTNNNPDINPKELEETLRAVLEEKEGGARCMNCGSPIWVAGSALVGSYMCFTCLTGEADGSDDFEVLG
ncbi:hypothetical protein QE612_08675 [Streptococcus suis]|uniref:Uncharacterized protein n=1 Tax=Streptococcus suis TaxID=1307 RepID=A0A0Z8ES42_STRSU|nr:hypothetical protein [Streptococcus suis]ANC99839.1 hypothetical protein A6M16_04795 [Streptococcus suis]AOM74559.1 hypothetical protein BFP66_04685 [Streptococcus suis]MBL6514602.1 hypothetical protein [Streptococcus suis]MBS8058028.1 hypothetical protein [Streptococcus suis]MBS8113570.1 hypothetical protein [Streptococcus suis]